MSSEVHRVNFNQWRSARSRVKKLAAGVVEIDVSVRGISWFWCIGGETAAPEPFGGVRI